MSVRGMRDFQAQKHGFMNFKGKIKPCQRVINLQLNAAFAYDTNILRASYLLELMVDSREC